jgi:Putative heavy-metal chelation
LSTSATHEVIVDQKRRDKYAVKSRLFADEAELVLQRKGSRAVKGHKPHIHVIGAMAGTHAALLARGFEVTAADMSPDVIGQNLGGVTVCDGTQNRKLIETADLVIMTGMTFPNRTLPSLIEAARANNTSTMIWAVTGRNLGPYYTRHGIDCVISDPAPFLSLPGPATIGICVEEFRRVPGSGIARMLAHAWGWPQSSVRNEHPKAITFFDLYAVFSLFPGPLPA